jgi:ABC-type branched-subunit amino acid transport system substrate-binding protein
MTRLRLGACLSLTGRYGRFGRQAAHGLRAWQRLAGADVELELEDDGSDPELFAKRFPRVASRCELLLGPYSTQLMRAAGEAMSEIDRVLWNQGGSGDDVQALCPGRIVSVLAPTSRYALPFVGKCAAADERVPLWVVRGRGRFGRQVAAGAVEHAQRQGLKTVEECVDHGFSFDGVPEAWDLFSAGRFEDDVAIVNAARAAERPPRAIGSIAAGVQDFPAQVERPDGIYGIAQWSPGRADQPDLGPAEADFISTYVDVAQSRPDYPAVQAAAGAVVATRCAELAGSLDREALWHAAAALDTSTLFGAFKIDASTGAQRGHATVLLRWRGDRLELAP